MLVPDLSNRTSDARWFSLLSWSLWLSDQAPWQKGSDSQDALLSTRVGAAARYKWLRPLELLWVARTHALCNGEIKGRQLPGIRAIQRWGKAQESCSEAARDSPCRQTNGTGIATRAFTARNAGPCAACQALLSIKWMDTRSRRGGFKRSCQRSSRWRYRRALQLQRAFTNDP